MLKQCHRCTRELPLSAFNLDRRGSGKYGRQGRCRECMKLDLAEYHQGTRRRVLSHYSGGSMRCACCGEDEIEFLGIDHIHGDGAQHRREVRPSAIYRWLIKHKFPPGIQVLCHNCNLSKGYYGLCPHQEGSSTGSNGPSSAYASGIDGALTARMSVPGQASGDGRMSMNGPPEGNQSPHGTHQGGVVSTKFSPVASDGRHAAAVALSKLGASKGGRARAAVLSSDERRAIAKKASAIRWAKNGITVTKKT
jgi:hypothetical protein